MLCLAVLSAALTASCLSFHSPERLRKGVRYPEGGGI